MRSFYFLFLSALLLGCSEINRRYQAQKPYTPANGYHLLICKVDNKVKAYVDDSLVFASNSIHGKKEVDIDVNMTPFVKTGEEVIKVELYNGDEPYDIPQNDTRWTIFYEIIIEGELVDFVSETKRDSRLGKVFEMTHTISELENMDW